MCKLIPEQVRDDIEKVSAFKMCKPIPEQARDDALAARL